MPSNKKKIHQVIFVKQTWHVHLAYVKWNLAFQFNVTLWLHFFCLLYIYLSIKVTLGKLGREQIIKQQYDWGWCTWLCMVDIFTASRKWDECLGGIGFLVLWPRKTEVASVVSVMYRFLYKRTSWKYFLLSSFCFSLAPITLCSLAAGQNIQQLSS